MKDKKKELYMTKVEMFTRIIVSHCSSNNREYGNVVVKCMLIFISLILLTINLINFNFRSLEASYMTMVKCARP